MKIFYDVDTQNDFMNKDGALYVPGAEEIKQNLEKLTKYAANKYIPIVGSVDWHFGTEEYKQREGELQKWGGPFPDHCTAYQKGSEKIKETTRFVEDPCKYFPEDKGILRKIYVHNVPNKLDRPVCRFEIAGKLADLGPSCGSRNSLLFEKQSYDVFTNPAFEVFLQMADVKEAIVYGVAADYCVKAAVLGMQKRGIQCYVVEDAIKGVAPETTKSALEEMLEAGAKFVKTSDVLEGKVI